ncbi:ABC transporter ATP-binding protein [Paenibacillus sp. L3-i20]|uniref:ABC transporter ATP-binding protein n=1 Tax=Paenibacillus sp. L3-i20 TaxID=2905833 RepID=UPI001EDD21EE|nr:ABC transporter ATP-binding protein [Paenibacillus sp. L3-i20]GKU76151.1 putative ABC transporter ATP-binding protein YxlF [Paenibacillus sp. L3-i20]
MTDLLQVKGLTKIFGSMQAVNGIDFTIKEGHCVALLGPNGAGKTTTIRMLTGLLKPTKGSVQFHQANRGDDSRQLLGYLPQSPSFHPWMSGLEYVIYAGELCGLNGSMAKKRAIELMERVGLGDAAKRRIGGYSGGMKQRLGLAQALVHRPKLLIMDEPVSALDPLGRREVLHLLQELKKEISVLFSTHVLHDAEELCDDVVIINKGQVALQGSLATIRNTHRKPIIELEVEMNQQSRAWLATFMNRVHNKQDQVLMKFTSIEGVELTDNRLRITATDIDAARWKLLEEITKERVKVNRFTVGHSSLEDLFMKVVSQ